MTESCQSAPRPPRRLRSVNLISEIGLAPGAFPGLAGPMYIAYNQTGRPGLLLSRCTRGLWSETAAEH
eukprot:13172139-Alexandrium_andersonii.AAC.1